MYGKLLGSSPLGMNSTLSRAARGPKNVVTKQNLDRDTQVASEVFHSGSRQQTADTASAPTARIRHSKGSMEGHRGEKSSYIEMDGHGYGSIRKPNSSTALQQQPRERSNPYTSPEVGRINTPRISDTRRKRNDKLGQEDASQLF